MVAQTRDKIDRLTLRFTTRGNGKLTFCGARRTDGRHASAKVVLRDAGLNLMFIRLRIIQNPSGTVTKLSIKEVYCPTLSPFNSSKRSFRWRAEPPPGKFPQRRYPALQDRLQNNLEALLQSHQVIERTALPFWRRWLHIW